MPPAALRYFYGFLKAWFCVVVPAWCSHIMSVWPDWLKFWRKILCNKNVLDFQNISNQPQTCSKWEVFQKINQIGELFSYWNFSLTFNCIFQYFRMLKKNVYTRVSKWYRSAWFYWNGLVLFKAIRQNCRPLFSESTWQIFMKFLKKFKNFVYSSKY